MYDMELMRQFAEAAKAPEGDIFSALGIDWMMLIFQIVAFLILVWLLGKFVYPWLMKSVDERQEKIEASAKAAADAQAIAVEAEKKVAKLLRTARTEAEGIVATAKAEATAALELSEKKSKKYAEQIAANAHDQIEKDVLAAKKALHNETIELVAFATEKVVGKAVSKDIDNAIIANALKESK
ncbi:MAG TPA: F0F1 ATP synthase subunit B [Candidatus Saccharimonadales bacterium]|nr:F0F1 ATP synthase subunit B [Candidatus Saccharimonadales bacterium]